MEKERNDQNQGNRNNPGGTPPNQEQGSRGNEGSQQGNERNPSGKPSNP